VKLDILKHDTVVELHSFLDRGRNIKYCISMIWRLTLVQVNVEHAYYILFTLLKANTIVTIKCVCIRVIYRENTALQIFLYDCSINTASLKKR
jgi:hypothetical protein